MDPAIIIGIPSGAPSIVMVNRNPTIIIMKPKTRTAHLMFILLQRYAKAIPSVRRIVLILDKDWPSKPNATLIGLF